MSVVMADFRAVPYRRHGCTRRHRSLNTLLRCVWPKAHWITGSGRWASVSRCRGVTVMLWPAEAEARRALEAIAAFGCGGRCTQKHALIRLSDELVAGVAR